MLIYWRNLVEEYGTTAAGFCRGRTIFFTIDSINQKNWQNIAFVSGANYYIILLLRQVLNLKNIL